MMSKSNSCGYFISSMKFVVLFCMMRSMHFQRIDWISSSSLEKWYTPLDMCLLLNDTSNPIESIMTGCEKKITSANTSVTPFSPPRCRAGNSWPSKGGFCSPIDIPYSKRDNLRKAVKGYDDPSQQPLRILFSQLSKEKGALLLIGDSVMQQYYNAMACELEREGLWKDSSQFKNTDGVRYVMTEGQKGKSNEGVPIRFVPIYHYINGKYDRVANASMHYLRKAVDGFLATHESVMIFMNQGLHYLSNPAIKDFNRLEYTKQITEALSYLDSKITDNLSKKKIRVIWRETSAQHFPTYNGYWPGVKYAVNMDVKCVPVKNYSPEGDWRNKDVKEIIRANRLNISIAPFYQQTLPLWGSHVNGHLRDCTHLCWSPMLYQPLFHFMADAMT